MYADTPELKKKVYDDIRNDSIYDLAQADESNPGDDPSNSRNESTANEVELAAVFSSAHLQQLVPQLFQAGDLHCWLRSMNNSAL